MKKKMLFLMAAIALFVPSVMAAEKTASNEAELTTAFKTAASGDVIKLTSDIENIKSDKKALRVDGGRDITLDLNGHNITIDPATTKDSNGSIDVTYRSIIIEDGKLTIKGKGVITHETHVAVNVWALNTGSTGSSKLVVEKDVTLKGKTALSVFEYDDKTKIGTNATVDFYGKAIGYENGITINGNIQQANNAPVVNIKSGAEISATDKDGVAIYAAGNGTWNISEGVTVTGVGSAIGIKAGTLNIDGGTFTATGDYNAKPKSLPGDMDPSGCAIQVENNSGYYGHVKLNITGGEFTSQNGNVILEHGSDTTTAVENITIAGGSFTAAEGEDTIVVSKGLASLQNSDNTAVKPIAIGGGYFANGIDNEYIENGNIIIDFATILDGEVTDLGNELGSIVVPAGTVLDEDTISDLEDLIGEEEDGYKLEGYYFDSKLKNKADFTKAFDENTTIYMNFVKVETKNATKTEENPETSDINLALILSMIALGSAGAVISYKKKNAKVNG